MSIQLIIDILTVKTGAPIKLNRLILSWQMYRPKSEEGRQLLLARKTAGLNKWSDGTISFHNVTAPKW